MPPRYLGAVDERQGVSAKTKVRFLWRIRAQGLDEESEVQVLCRDAVRRGVHLPTAWKSIWKLAAGTPAVDEMAAAAVARAWSELGLCGEAAVECRPLQNATQNLAETSTARGTVFFVLNISTPKCLGCGYR